MGDSALDDALIPIGGYASASKPASLGGSGLEAVVAVWWGLQSRTPSWDRSRSSRPDSVGPAAF